MGPILVTGHAADPINAAGLRAFLRTRTEVTALDGPPTASCDVAVLAADRSTAEVLTTLRSWQPSPAPILLLANHLTGADLLPMIECRVAGVLRHRGTNGDRLIAAITALANGSGVLPPDLLGDLLRHVERLQREVLTPRGLNAAGLTPREVEVLRLMAEGLDNADIADELACSERTVHNIVSTMTGRLKLRNRTHAVAYAVRAGLV
ncbi:DNA-binding NarL/FixJ family response regulator [Crossiella equi]|uniref:DNA-binding NarL/FixJ family response regulator n=1 Tax=Crossiella equi TaxID=130796 RepID=A0ABS5ARP2_9PSEU|nr:response regulator transcription factor [Crossiella equi]MBP2479243.1 DNA-binding NarL/FixJ family response regulator [Crossiella equi]